MLTFTNLIPLFSTSHQLNLYIILSLLHSPQSKKLMRIINQKENDFDKFIKSIQFNLAEKHLGVPKLFDPSDMINGIVDDHSLMTYISLFKDAFGRQSNSPTI